ncbi:Ubiquinol-cytochrome-c reductase complex assembly factor 1 [Smittium mucronatum]|uniref:Ubiquinol-cytochrome-c reductase complex assembly factor 1 n=1 Tax=Smittium mucronatum TaxID=133383 RepID=A0A1R0H9D0_9FUNG|nr:Ubiquinol-cytochrome-c reductase complex assembly factor 1 [Smittium mucronatum]
MNSIIRLGAKVSVNNLYFSNTIFNVSKPSFSLLFSPTKYYSSDSRKHNNAKELSKDSTKDIKSSNSSVSEEIEQPNLTLSTSRKPIRFTSATGFLQKLFKPLVPQYQSIEIGRNIYSRCSFSEEQYDRFWLEQANMSPTFQSWFSITLLYVWLCLTRTRTMENSKYLKQQLVDCFFKEAEERIRKTGIRSGKIVNDSLKDLTANYFGYIMSFDEGLITNDAVLAGAVWRNILSNCENTETLYLLVLYIRRQLKMLDDLDNNDFILGKFKFEDIYLLSKSQTR